MNNYLKILLHLKNFEGDGKYHNIENLIPELSIEELLNVLTEIQDEGFIKFIEKEKRFDTFIITHNQLTNERNVESSPLNNLNDRTEPEPTKAKITFKGSKYLKEELEMKESGKYNISVTGAGANNTFVIDSKNVKIDNKPTFNNKVKKIIEEINNDNSIDNSTKSQIISTLETAKLEVDQNGTISKDIANKILTYGSNISSIAQLAISLFGG
jgi:hypothetical protein